MYEIFLPKFYNLCYHKINKIDRRLSLFGAQSYDEMKKSTTNTDDLYIIEELIRLGNMDEFMDEYDHEIVQRKLMNTYKIEGHNEGFKEGHSEGIKEGKLEIAKKLLEQNVSIDIISTSTGLSIEEIKNINA